MKSHIKQIVKALSFIVIAVALFGAANFMAQPRWGAGNDNPEYGIYEESQNTVETLFLGASHVHSGISPMEIYEEYGICSYDLSSSGQPMLTSYFWLEEFYRLQSETLDTVVLDISTLRHSVVTASCHKSIDPMHFSSIKMKAVKAYSDDFTDFISNMCPLFTYHERWKEITRDDFLKIDYEPQLYLRGYAYDAYARPGWAESEDDFSEISIPLRVLDTNEEETILDETAVKYFKKIVTFCKKHDIRLTLICTPTVWTSANHNAVQTLADLYGLDFIDFNVDPYYSEINFNIAADIVDGSEPDNLHSNYYGAMKISDYLGQYLIEECGNRDVRGDERYAFMDEELDDYQRYIASTTVNQYTDPCDYIEYAIEHGNYTVFISAQDDASRRLTDEQKDYFKSIGLGKLSGIGYCDSYLAIIEDGVVVQELLKEDPGGDGDASAEPLSYSGTLSDGTEYTVSSGGLNLGRISSTIIDGVERSGNSRGLNIVLYDNKNHEYVAWAGFDTHMSPERQIQNAEERLEAEIEDGATLAELSGTDRTLYLYNRMCDNEEILASTKLSMGDDGLFEYLAAFWDDEDIDIYITVKNDASASLTGEARAALSDLGLLQLSGIEYQSSYIGIVSGGKVILEETGEAGAAVEAKNEKYYLFSGIGDAGYTSSIVIDGKEYSCNEAGINIVIYDNITEMTADSISFDTGSITPALAAVP